MENLIEKLEKEKALIQLKVDLISRFYAFSYDDILKYKNVLNTDNHYLMENEFIQWENKLVKQMQDKIYFPFIYKIKNIKLDYMFFKKFESVIDFSTIYYSKNIVWSKKLIELYGDRFDCNKLITRCPLIKIDTFEKNKDKLDWSYISRCYNFNQKVDLIEEFKELWDWKKLSANIKLPISFEFIQKYINELDFNELSRNPASLELIYKYPTSKRWNWENVIVNPGIIYNHVSFNFIYGHYKRFVELNDHISLKMKEIPLYFFMSRVITRQSNDISFFLEEKFIRFMPWHLLSKCCVNKFELSFIEEHKDKLNFKESSLIRHNKDIITTQFILGNYELFDTERYSFYYLPLTIDLIKPHLENINWYYLSSCEKLDWTWDFINEHFSKFDLFRLSQNRGIYEKVILKQIDL